MDQETITSRDSVVHTNIHLDYSPDVQHLSDHLRNDKVWYIQ